MGNVGPAFPPTFISSGNADPLEPQARRFAARLAELGVPTEELFFAADVDPPLAHEYQFDLDVPAGARSFAAMIDFIRSRVG